MIASFIDAIPGQKSRGFFVLFFLQKLLYNVPNGYFFAPESNLTRL
nr:MAG TPA: hypothetical protein [Caudoviricetes sp.]